MQPLNARIGFRDRWIMLIMIPTLAFLVPIVFMGVRFGGPIQYTLNIYLHSLVTTAAVWLGNRYLMIWARNKYPSFEKVKKRIKVQSVAMLVYTFFITTLLGFIITTYFDTEPLYPGCTPVDMLIDGNTTSLFCTITIAAIYESSYFMTELKKSVEERERLKRESLLAQLDALRTQINPHFLFNNLNTLTAIIPEEPETAIRFVQQLSKVYRHILEVKDEPSIAVQDELQVLHAYSFLLQTRFGNNLHISFDIAEDQLQKRIVPLSLQLLMENAIKHNIVSEEQPLHIKVYTQGESLIFTNNLQRRKTVVDSVGMGLENIRIRSRILCNRPVEVIVGTDHFSVCMPLLSKDHENIYS